MLWVGLTGGIGAGKSAVSRLLVREGAVLVDADRVAREVVEPGTPGLQAVVDAFGAELLRPDGALDREALGRVVFADPADRQRLNAIVHPLIGARTAELAQQAEASGAPVLVHDVPLLAEAGLGPGYHLVVVVETPLAERLRRLVHLRGMPEQDARARMAAQATDEQRRAIADVLLRNDGDLRHLASAVGELWRDRLVPYADNLAAGRPGVRGPVVLVPHDESWPAAGERLVARLRQLCGPRAVAVEHVGSTAVPGLAAKDVVDLQVEVAERSDVEALGDVLTRGGFPRVAGIDGDPPRPEVDPDPEQWRKQVHRSADPGRPANVHVRVAGSAGARCAVALRDLLRRDEQARRDYEQDKRRLAEQHPDDVDAYSEGKTERLVPLLVRALAEQPR